MKTMTEPEVFYLIQRKSDSLYCAGSWINDDKKEVIAWVGRKYFAKRFESEKEAVHYISFFDEKDVEIIPFVSIPLSEYQQLKK